MVMLGVVSRWAGLREQVMVLGWAFVRGSYNYTSKKFANPKLNIF